MQAYNYAWCYLHFPIYFKCSMSMTYAVINLSLCVNQYGILSQSDWKNHITAFQWLFQIKKLSIYHTSNLFYFLLHFSF